MREGRARRRMGKAVKMGSGTESGTGVDAVAGSIAVADPLALAARRRPSFVLGTDPITVFLVEDNAADVRMFQEQIGRAGFTRVTLKHAPRLSLALEEIRRSGCDIMFLDLTLPDREGLATVREAIEGAPNTPIVVLTGALDEEMPRLALREGAQDYLAKGTYEPEELARVLRYSIERFAWSRSVREAELQYRAIVDTAREGILTIDPDGNVTLVNPALCRMLDRPADALVGRPAAELFRASEEDGGEGGDEDDPFPLEGEAEIDLSREDGGSLHVLASCSLIRDERSEIANRVVLLTDVTSRKRAELELSLASFADALTGLPNRLLFEDRLSHALKRRARMSTPVAVVILDLDGFKAINDSFGHPVGDALITMVGQRLVDLTRPEDTVARMGGDEFAILIDKVTESDIVHTVAERLAASFSEPFQVMGSPVHVSASMGISLLSSEQEGPEDLLRYADVAMYRAKERSGTAYEVFDPRKDFGATQRLQVQTELREAIQRQHLRVHYQPLVDLRDGRIVGGEGLVRWEHPRRGFIFPGEFIALAEESGLVRELGESVLRQATERWAAWAADDARHESLTLAINVSARQLGDPDFPDVVSDVLADTGLDPGRLQLEVQESAAVRASQHLAAYRKLGVRIAIDDIGKGHASLEHLTQLEVDVLKIDGTFVGGLGTSSRDTAVVEAMLVLGQRLGVTVMAEGIETEDQLRRLLDLGCTVGQGYLFAKAVTPRAFERLLQGGPLGPGNEQAAGSGGE